MTPEKYIISKLEEISRKMDNIHFRYAFDKTTLFHIIEVTPDSVRYTDEYAESECEIWSEFFNLFPNEDLLISEVSKFNNMSNVIYETPLNVIFKSPNINPKDISKYSYEGLDYFSDCMPSLLAA